MDLLPSFGTPASIGIYCWNPEGLQQKSFSKVTAEEVISGLSDKDKTPEQVADLKKIQLPLTFPKVRDQRILNKFPHDAGYIVPLYVAKTMGVRLEDIDFLLGGSSLNVLATQKIERRDPSDDTKYLVQRCPTLNVTLVCKSRLYEQNYADIGFQFERLVTGGRCADIHSHLKFESLQIMKIAGFTVLFSAEVDAVDDAGMPVEIKSGNPQWFGMKVMFQMISSGSQTLVRADKRRNQLIGIKQIPLQDMIREHGRRALQNADENIVAALTDLKKSQLIQETGTPVELDFSAGVMELKPAPEADLLPSQEVIKQLLGE